MMKLYTKQEWADIEAAAAIAPGMRKGLAEVAKLDFRMLSPSQLAAVEELCTITEQVTELELLVRAIKREDPTLKNTVQQDTPVSTQPVKRQQKPVRPQPLPKGASLELKRGVLPFEASALSSLPIPRQLLWAAGWID